jgi:hypothetical protein
MQCVGHDRRSRKRTLDRLDLDCGHLVRGSVVRNFARELKVGYASEAAFARL